MTLSKFDLFDRYVEEKKNKVGNFDLKVQTSVLLYKFFTERDYSFYFCPKIKPVNQTKTNFKTPDFHGKKKDKLDLIGEIKQSLPDPKRENYRPLG